MVIEFGTAIYRIAHCSFTLAPTSYTWRLRSTSSIVHNGASKSWYGSPVGLRSLSLVRFAAAARSTVDCQCAIGRFSLFSWTTDGTRTKSATKTVLFQYSKVKIYPFRGQCGANAAGVVFCDTPVSDYGEMSAEGFRGTCVNSFFRQAITIFYCTVEELILLVVNRRWGNIYQLYFASIAAQYKNIQSIRKYENMICQKIFLASWSRMVFWFKWHVHCNQSIVDFVEQYQASITMTQEEWLPVKFLQHGTDTGSSPIATHCESCCSPPYRSGLWKL